MSKPSLMRILLVAAANPCFYKMDASFDFDLTRSGVQVYISPLERHFPGARLPLLGYSNFHARPTDPPERSQS
jgi:hypothetical protein